MRKLIYAAATGLMLSLTGASSANATGICNCCSGEVEELCKAACEAGNSDGRICRPVAFYGDASGIGGDTPLNGFSFQNLSLDGATPLELETLRRWLERERRKLERTARRSLRDYRRGRIGAEDYEASRATREEAIINYQLAIQEYLTQPR